MRALRLAAYSNLDFSDGSVPNCLRLAFHDAATCANCVRPLPRNVQTRGCLPIRCIFTAASWSGWQPRRSQGVRHTCSACAAADRVYLVVQVQEVTRQGRVRTPARHTQSVQVATARACREHCPRFTLMSARALNMLCRRRANGSVLNEIAAGNYSAHAGLDICRGKVLDIVPRVRADACPELTYADAIAVLGAHKPVSYDLSTHTRALGLI